MRRWISVKQRLPKKENTYIVYVPSALPEMEMAYFKNGHGFVYYLQSEITHWQPRPKPPKRKR